jgi:hypothetical protein
MARHIDVPRKRRTREHVIADMGVHHDEGHIGDAGHTMQRMEKDYGYDLLLFTFDEQGYSEPDFLPLQVKAAESLQASGADYVFDVDIRDYNLWMQERMPVILILFDASRARGYWIPFQAYFREDVTRRQRKGAKTIRVRVPKRQVVNRRAIATWRSLKWEARGPRIGGETWNEPR